MLVMCRTCLVFLPRCKQLLFPGSDVQIMPTERVDSLIHKVVKAVLIEHNKIALRNFLTALL